VYGQRAFFYELMPSGYAPDFATISSFFGAQANDEGGYDFVGEHIPDNWVNRVEPYTHHDIETMATFPSQWQINPAIACVVHSKQVCIY